MTMYFGSWNIRTLLDNDKKEKFYKDDLENILSSIPETDVLGDSIACVSKEWHEAIGKEGVGKCNANGSLFLSKCAQHGLFITNTTF